MKTSKPQQTFLIIVTSLLAVAFIFPLAVMIITSFKPVDEVFDMRLIPTTFTLDNYYRVFVESDLLVYVKNSVIIAVTVTIASLIVNSMSAFAIANLRFPGRYFIFILILSTIMIPFTVIMIPLFLTVRSMGLTNSLWGIILPAIPNAFGIFLLRQFFIGLPKELEEAAKIDGCSYFGIFVRMALPLSKPILATLAAMYFIGNWNNYLWPLIVATKKEYWVIQIAIASFRDQFRVEWSLVLAASVVATVPIILLFMYFQKYLVEGIKMTGIKD